MLRSRQAREMRWWLLSLPCRYLQARLPSKYPTARKTNSREQAVSGVSSRAERQGNSGPRLFTTAPQTRKMQQQRVNNRRELLCLSIADFSIIMLSRIIRCPGAEAGHCHNNMGNCSTQKQQISSPGDPTLTHTPFLKPDPVHFHPPPSMTTNDADDQSKPNDADNKDQQMEEAAEIARLKELTKQGPYVDGQFKSEKKALGEKLCIDNIQWRRPVQFLKDQPVLFQGELQTYQLKQGRLENSYFVSAFASLAPHNNFPLVLAQVLRSSVNSAYIIRLFLDGTWKRIVIDDVLPLLHGTYLFSNYQKQVWIWMLEKALAKLCGSYEGMEKWMYGHFVAGLTGAPYRYLPAGTSVDQAWKFIRDAMAHNHIIVVTNQKPEPNSYFQNQSPFSYPVLDCEQVHILTATNKKLQRVLKLQNPWGRYQWKGRWSQYSDVWSEELRHQLNYEKADDSVMWINIEDMMKNFGQACVCVYDREYGSKTMGLQFGAGRENEIKGVFMKVKASSTGYLSVIQSNHKNFPKGNYKYSTCRLILLQLDPASHKPSRILHQHIATDYYTSLQFQLDSGMYYLLIQIDWHSTQRQCTLQAYCDIVPSMAEDPNVPSPQQLFYELAVLDQGTNGVLQVQTYTHDPDIRRVWGKIGGYYYYHYYNNSKQSRCLSEVVKLGESHNVVLCGEGNEENFAVRLDPGQEKLVKIKILDPLDHSFNPIVVNHVMEVFSKESLLAMLRKKPTKVRQREIQNEKIDVYIRTFEHAGGVALLYINDMSKHSFIEEIRFEIRNLRMEQEDLDENNKYNLELEPHSEKLLSFVVLDPSKSYTFKSTVEYYLGTPEFKF